MRYKREVGRLGKGGDEGCWGVGGIGGRGDAVWVDLAASLAGRSWFKEHQVAGN